MVSNIVGKIRHSLRRFRLFLLQKHGYLNSKKWGRFTGNILPLSFESTYLESAIAKGGSLIGRCLICDQRTSFLFPADFVEQLLAMGISREIIPQPVYLLRESLLCGQCHSANRERQVAYVLLKTHEAETLSELSGLHILNAESSGALHNRLLQNPKYCFSEYFGPEYAPSEVIKGIRNEDFQKLSFADDSFDVVITRDVFEHIPDPYQAHREVFRVLKKGGRHIFTVPFSRDSFTDIVRAELAGSEIIHHMPPQYHANPVDPENGALVFRIFSFEMLVELKRIGFAPALWHIYEPDAGIIGPNALVIEAYKPEQVDPAKVL